MEYSMEHKPDNSVNTISIMLSKMENTILKELQELKNLTLLDAKKVLTMEDAAILTGLSKSHLYKLVCYKKIPYYKQEGGKRTYFDKDELNSWMLNYRVKTASEIEIEATNYVVTGRRGWDEGKVLKQKKRL